MIEIIFGVRQGKRHRQRQRKRQKKLGWGEYVNWRVGEDEMGRLKLIVLYYGLATKKWTKG